MKLFTPADRAEFMRRIGPVVEEALQNAYQRGYEDGKALAIRDKLYREVTKP